MKKKWLILWGIIIVILVISIFIIVSVISTPNDPLIIDAKACMGLSYPGTMALAHYIGEECYSVYNGAFKGNLSYHCKYLKSEIDKAICLGASGINWDNKSICNKFDEKNKEICILNLIQKIYEINLEELEEEDICKGFTDQTFFSYCLGYKSIVNKNYQFCDVNGEYNNFCLNQFMNSGKINSEKGNEFCNEFFNDSHDIFYCQYQIGVEKIKDNESIELTNSTKLFFEYHFLTENWYKYSAEEWRTLSEEEIQQGWKPASPLNSYICTNKFTLSEDIEKYCIKTEYILADRTPLFDTSLIKPEHWTYYD